MSNLSAVFLDTSIFDGQQYNFSSTALSTFLKAATDKKLLLLLPDPTEREILRHIRTRSTEAIEALEEARKKAPFLAKWKHFPKAARGKADVFGVLEIANSEWKQFLEQFDVLRLGYRGINVELIMDWYDTSTPPFNAGKKRKEFPDAFAVAMLEKYVKEHKGSHVGVVSADPDFEAACERYKTLHYFPTLPRLTETLLLSDEAIRDILLSDLSGLQKAIELEASESIAYFHNVSGYEIEKTLVRGAHLRDVRIVAMGDSACTIAFEVEIEVEHKLVWYEYDEDQGEDARQSQDVLVTDAFDGSAKVTLDLKEKRVKAITHVSFDMPLMEVTENPTRNL
jgi:hypothetical protein